MAKKPRILLRLSGFYNIRKHFQKIQEFCSGNKSFYKACFILFQFLPDSGHFVSRTQSLLFFQCAGKSQNFLSPMFSHFSKLSSQEKNLPTFQKQRDGWLSRQRTSLLRQHSVLDSRHPSKIKNGRHKLRSGRHTLARQKNIQKNFTKIRRLIFVPIRASFTPTPAPCYQVECWWEAQQSSPPLITQQFGTVQSAQEQYEETRLLFLMSSPWIQSLPPRLYVTASSLTHLVSYINQSLLSLATLADG